jgi:CHAT domain-containing protein/predicted negative regulator of RcsB-dependent stress response
MLFIVSVVPAGAAPVTAQTVARTPLEYSKPVSLPIAAGQTYEFVLALPPGDYALVTLQQQKVDLVMKVEIDGSTVTVDIANGSTGQESLSLLGRAADYIIKVSTKDKKPAPGSFEITLSERRTAGLPDQENVAAQLVFLKAKSTRSDVTPEKTRERAAQFEEARRRWHDINERRGEANALLNRGMEQYFLDDLSATLTSYEEALNIFRELKRPLDEAVVLYNIGIAKTRLADLQGGLTNFSAALAGFRAQDDQKRIGQTLYQIGHVYYLAGDLAQAQQSLTEALSIRAQIGDTGGEASTLMAIGRIYANGFKSYDEGLDYYQRALALLPPGSNPRGRAQVLGDIGRFYFDKQVYQTALDKYDEGLKEIAESDKPIRAEILMYRGMVYAALTRHQEALASYEEALELQTAAGDSVGRGQTLKNMALSYSALGDEQAALKKLNDALDIWTTVMYRTAEADTRYEIARVQTKLGNLIEARKQIELAFPIIESLRTKIANQQLRTSYFASAQKFYELYIDVLMRRFAVTRDRAVEALALEYSERARTRSMLDVLMELRAGIRSGANPDDLKKEAEIQHDLTALSQRQMLSSVQTASQTAHIHRRLATLLKEYRDLEARIRKNSPHYAALTHPQPISIAAIQELLAPDQMLLEYALGDQRSYVWAVTNKSIKSYELPGSSKIEALAQRLHDLLAASNLPPERAPRRADEEYNETARLLSNILLGPIESLSSQRLLIVTSGKLQYVPFNALPVTARGADAAGETTRSGMVPLLKYHEIETPPSMSVLAQLKNERPKGEDSKPVKTVAVIADPVYNADDGRFSNVRLGKTSSNSSSTKMPDLVTRAFKDGRVPRLIFSLREADSILSVLPPGKGDKIVDFSASREFVTGPGRFSQYRMVHFATHGIIDYDSPELSGLLLSLYDDQHRPQAGLLQMHEIYNLKIPVELAVLSACGTGVGNEMRGEGFASLSRAFVYAGARRVIASLWEVGDASTAELMSTFYRHLLVDQLRPAAALRAAQFEMWDKGRNESPYSWAAFVTYGDPHFEQIKTKPSNAGSHVEGARQP